MWILSRVNNEDKVYLLCDKPKYTVGRHKNCDIIGESTQSSLGRFHATLHPYEDRVEIIDTESKYGTYINDQINSNVKIDPNVPVQLKDGDTVRFGFMDFTWKLEKVEMVVLTSTLTEVEKNNLRKVVSTLGGQLIDQWSTHCTHLVVKSVTFTVKVLQGLCHAIPIVKPEYFKVMLASIRSNGILPTVETFQPAIAERIAGGTVSLQPNIDRKRLFAGKTFVFMNSRQMETFNGIIACGMGECSSLDTKKWQKRSLVKPDVIVLSNTANSTQSQAAAETANELNDFLRSKGIRMIPESEIGFAVLYCSLEKFCNPSHKLKDNFETKSRAVPSTLLADNTPVNQDNRNSDATTSVNSITVPETVNQPNTSASTVPSNSEIISLMDDDDDLMLVESADFAVAAMEEVNKGKRKNSTEDIAGPSMKKPNLDKSASPSTMKTRFNIPERSTRSVTKIQNFATSETRIEKQSTVQERQDQSTKTNAEPPKTSIQDKRNLSLQTSSQCEPIRESNSENFSVDFSMIQGSQMRAANNTQSKCFTSTQIETPKRKRIAHRPNTSTFGGNDSDSDDDLFKFNNKPTAKKSRPTKDSDSDSDDNNRNYPQSSGPVGPVSIPIRTFTQPTSQIASNGWLSRPTPSQIDTTIRTKPKKQSNRVETTLKSSNSSSGWQIGQWCISTPPIQISNEGWCSKDTMKASTSDSEIKTENSNEMTTTTTDGLAESKWSETMNCGIQVITKSMNLMSTSGKVFKKQSFIVPTEIIKTTKIYEF